MTDYEYLLICTVSLVIVAFMLGRLWEHVGDQLEEEEKTNDEKRMYSPSRKIRNRVW